MEDKEIVALYLAREERAIDETAARYGSYCHAIAKNLLGNSADAEECVNDLWLSVWNSIPPNRPDVLRTYLGKLVRRIAVDRIRYRTAEKRGGGEIPLILDELSECLPAEDPSDGDSLLTEFLAELPEKERQVFLCRYYYGEPIREIAQRFGYTESRVKSMLYRARERLKHCLNGGRKGE